LLQCYIRIYTKLIYDWSATMCTINRKKTTQVIYILWFILITRYYINTHHSKCDLFTFKFSKKFMTQQNTCWLLDKIIKKIKNYNIVKYRKTSFYKKYIVICNDFKLCGKKFNKRWYTFRHNTCLPLTG